MTFDDLPDMLTVEQAAEVLQISRSHAYVAVAEYRSSGGRRGIPSIRIGRSWRVPTRALRRWMDDQLGEGAVFA